MAKYHLNERGEPGICRALNRCPFGGEDAHYPTSSAARTAYELRAPFSYRLPREGFNPDTLRIYREDSSKWLSTLTDGEREAVEFYARIGYSEVNGKLWRGELHELTPQLDSALEKSPPAPRELYRKPVVGESKEEVAATLDQWKKAGRVTLRGFTSTSAHPEGLNPLLVSPPTPSPWVSEEDLPDLDDTHRNVIMVLRGVSRGAPVGMAGSHSQEMEFLLPRNQSFEVKSVEETTYCSDRDILTGEQRGLQEKPATVVILDYLDL